MANAQDNFTLSVCATPQPSDLNQAGYEALTFVAIGKVGSIGESGTQTNILTYDTLDTTVSDKAKGISNAGDPEIEVARDYNDAGQIILRAAGLTNFKYAVKLEHNDSPDGILSNTVVYSRGLITGPVRPGGRNEDFDLEVYTLGNVQLEIVVDPV